MKASFNDFTKKFVGQVFVVFSIDEKIMNNDVYDKITTEIERLKTM